MLLTQYMKLKDHGPGDTVQYTFKPNEKGKGNKVATQTPKLTIEEKSDGPPMSTSKTYSRSPTRNKGP